MTDNEVPVDPLIDAMSVAMCGIAGEDYTESAAALRAELGRIGLQIAPKDAADMTDNKVPVEECVTKGDMYCIHAHDCGAYGGHNQSIHSPEAVDTIDTLEARIAELEGALHWYSVRVSDCRKIGSIPEGVAARNELSADGGKRARQALKEPQDG